MDTICNRQTESSEKVIRSLTARLEPTTRESSHLEPRELSRGLGLFDSVMVVVGAMIGSGIFIVPAEMARHIGSAGWLLVAWGVGRHFSRSPERCATKSSRQ
jgi:amino acid permease